MERIDRHDEVTVITARHLLDEDMEMLHKFPEGEHHCRFCGKWRQHIRFDEECPALLRAAMDEVRLRERDRCARICINEYARWKDVDRDSYGIAIGAIGAASNILCAIEQIPSVADSPVHDNERTGGGLS